MTKLPWLTSETFAYSYANDADHLGVNPWGRTSGVNFSPGKIYASCL
jgi:hypothetical protein